MFKYIVKKKNKFLFQIDIMGFHPSVTKELITKSIDYAKSITAIQEEVIKTIVYAKNHFYLIKAMSRFK